MKLKFLILFLGLCISCSVLQKRTAPLDFVDPEKIEIENIESKLKAGQYEQVVSLAEEFQKRNPYSLKLQKARYYKANAFEELGRWNEAADTYRIISLFSEKNQPEISAMSIYRLSYVYEALGEDDRVLTSLLEAKQYQTYLPVEVTKAEIPSRIAMVYAKQNNSKEANRWLAEADKGLKSTLDTRTEPLTPEWLAKIYYNMGSISTNQLSNENILTIIQGQNAIQKYLIRALQYEDPIWSAKSLKKLQLTYMDLWKAIEGYPEPSGFEPLVANKMKKDEQARLAGPFTELIQEAILYRPVRDQMTNTYQKSFFDMLDQLQTRLNSLRQETLYTPLTTVREKAPQKAEPSVKIAPSTDPNL